MKWQLHARRVAGSSIRMSRTVNDDDDDDSKADADADAGNNDDFVDVKCLCWS